MINEMTYDEILKSSEKMKNSCEIIKGLIADKETPDLEDFVTSVDSYTKYLDNTIELMMAADIALKDLIELKK